MDCEEKEHHSERVIVALLLLLVGISIGYAMLSTTLMINGNTIIKKATWDIHFDNINITPGSVRVNETLDEMPASIIDSALTKVEYTITLKNPGDFYEFTVDVVNSGTLDAVIRSTELTGIEGHENYAKYSVLWDDTNTEPSESEILKSNQRRKLRVRVEYDKDVVQSNLPSTDKKLLLKFSMNYVQSK